MMPRLRIAAALPRSAACWKRRTARAGVADAARARLAWRAARRGRLAVVVGGAAVVLGQAGAVLEHHGQARHALAVPELGGALVPGGGLDLVLGGDLAVLVGVAQPHHGVG